MKSKLLGMIGTAALALAYAAPTEAATFATIAVTGGATVSCSTDNPAACSAGFSIINSNLLIFTGSVSGFSIATLSVSSDTPGTATFAHTTDTKTDILYSGAGTGTVTVTFGSTGYTLPTGPELTLSASQTLNATNSTGSETSAFTGCGNAANTPALVGTCTSATPLAAGAGTTLGLGSSSPDVSFTRGAGAYSLVGQEVITMTSGSLGSFSGTVAVNAIPEPASLLLLGTGLAGVAARYRRRRNANVA